MLSGPVGLALTNSTITFLPLPTALEPKAPPRSMICGITPPPDLGLDEDIDKARPGHLQAIDEIALSGQQLDDLCRELAGLAFFDAGQNQGHVGREVTLAFVLGQFQGIPSVSGRRPGAFGHALLENSRQGRFSIVNGSCVLLDIFSAVVIAEKAENFVTDGAHPGRRSHPP